MGTIRVLIHMVVVRVKEGEPCKPLSVIATLA